MSIGWAIFVSFIAFISGYLQGQHSEQKSTIRVLWNLRDELISLRDENIELRKEGLRKDKEV